MSPLPQSVRNRQKRHQVANGAQRDEEKLHTGLYRRKTIGRHNCGEIIPPLGIGSGSPVTASVSSVTPTDRDD